MFPLDIILPSKISLDNRVMLKKQILQIFKILTTLNHKNSKSKGSKTMSLNNFRLSLSKPLISILISDNKLKRLKTFKFLIHNLRLPIRCLFKNWNQSMKLNNKISILKELILILILWNNLKDLMLAKHFKI